MSREWVMALLGGTFIGISASIVLLVFGRVTGVSGMVNQVLTAKKSRDSMAVWFLVGLILSGLFNLGLQLPIETNLSYSAHALSGVLVGVGVTLANGCTSGHGICGNSRFSQRSIVATLVFIGTAILTTLVIRKVGVIL